MEKGYEISAITSTNTLSSYDIEIQGFSTVAEALESIPGIDVQAGGKGQATLKLRGFDQRDVKVLIDGVPAHEAYFGSGEKPYTCVTTSLTGQSVRRNRPRQHINLGNASSLY